MSGISVTSASPAPEAASAKPAQAEAQTVETNTDEARQAPAARQTQPAQSSEARLSDILRSYGFKATEENRAMLTLLLDNGFPLTRENIMKMNQALKLTESPEQALFLLLNKMRLTKGNAAQLLGLADGQTKITEQISRLLAAVENLDDPALKRQILQILGKVNGEGNGGTAARDAALARQTARPQTNTTQTAAGPAASQTQTSASRSGPAQANAAAQQPGTAQPNTAAQQPGGTVQPNTAAQQQGITQPGAAAQQNAGAQQTDGARTNTAVPGQPSASQSAAERQTDTARPNASQAQPLSGSQANTAEQKSAQSAERQSVPPPQSGQARNVPVSVEFPAFEHTEQSRQASEHKTSANSSSRLSFRIADSTPQDIDRFINNLREALSETRQTLHRYTEQNPNKGAQAEQVLKETQSLSEHIDFVSQIKNQMFVQLPVFHNGQETQTALHVYKDAKKSSSGGGGDAASALIALDTLSMGHFETYVQKAARSVNCQFRLQDKDVERLVRAHIHELSSLLSEYGYSLDAFSFLPQSEPYTLLDSPKIFEGEEDADVTAERVVFEGKA